MNRTMSLLSLTLATAIGLVLLPMGFGLAQAAPPISRLTPLQRQQIGRDLVPLGTQAFFKAGQVTLEQEIRLLTKPRSSLSEPLLNVNQSLQIPLNEHVEQPGALHHHPAK